MSFFQHPNAIVESTQIGDQTRIWAFAHILPHARLGEDCNICDHVFIENDVVIGDRVTVKSGVQIWDGIVIEDDVFIGPNATFTNDPFPRSKQYPERYAKTIIKKGASIGANATILPGITIGRYAMVGAGAVVTNDVPPYAIVYGNPARIKGYDAAHQQTSPFVEKEAQRATNETSVQGAVLYELPLIRDLRGNLSAAEYNKDLPFMPARYFLVYDVPSKDVRGEHAHRNLHQFLVCVRGAVTVMADDGKNRAIFQLDRPNLGLYIAAMVWAAQYQYSQDAMLLVLASDIYKPQDYIRDYDEFLHEIARQADDTLS